jgi:hypothetical protein
LKKEDNSLSKMSTTLPCPINPECNTELKDESTNGDMKTLNNGMSILLY